MGKSLSKRVDPNESLLAAILERSQRKVKRAIKAGANVNLKYENGRFPLRVAANEFGGKAIVRELIRHGADVNAQDGEGRTALQGDARQNLDITLLLLKNGADMNIKDFSGNTAWHVRMEQLYIRGIARYFKYYVCKFLKYQCDVNSRDGRGHTILHLVVKRGSRDSAMSAVDQAIHLFIKIMADVNATDNRCMRPLYYSIGNERIARKLISCGAEVDISNPRGLSALHIRLLDYDLSFLPLFITPNTVNAVGTYNRTILHLAASLGFQKHIEYLLSVPGIDVYAKDIFRQTCLHCAAQTGNRNIVNAILNAGADLKALDYSGKSVFHLAAIHGHTSLIKLLIHKGLDPNTPDSQGRNSLHYAVMYRKPESVEYLLQVKTDSEGMDRKGKRPRDYLLECEGTSLIWKMLKGGTPVSYVLALEGDPPFDQACEDVSHMTLIAKQPGIGAVSSIDGFLMEDFVALVRGKVEEVICDAISECAEVKVTGCGSSLEGSKVGIPDELDFLIELFSIELRGEYDREGNLEMRPDEEKAEQLNMDNMSYGVWLWEKLMMWWSKHQEIIYICPSRPCESMPQFKMPLPPQRHPDRTTCATWVWMYNDGAFKDFPVSINFFPALKIKDGTGFLVPKIPHRSRKLSKINGGYLGRILHPTMEVNYLKDLDERIMDVYITAKSLRKPGVCGFKIKNEKGEIVPVSEYTTSYWLKTAFMHMIPVFTRSHMSLGKMVLMVYELLERTLARCDLPAYFLTSSNVLPGSRLSPELSLLAARAMTKFVRYLYQRDFSPSEQEGDSFQEKISRLRAAVVELEDELLKHQ